MGDAMRRTSLLLVGLVGTTFGFAPAPVFRERPDDSAAVLKRLQGTWAVSRSEQGRTMLSQGGAHTIKIEKDVWTYFYAQNIGPGTQRFSYSLKIDPKSTPAEIDCIRSETYMLNGVYELKGDTLKVVFRRNEGGKKDRAKDLIHPGASDYFMLLERRP